LRLSCRSGHGGGLVARVPIARCGTSCSPLPCAPTHTAYPSGTGKLVPGAAWVFGLRWYCFGVVALRTWVSGFFLRNGGAMHPITPPVTPHRPPPPWARGAWPPAAAAAAPRRPQRLPRKAAGIHVCHVARVRLIQSIRLHNVFIGMNTLCRRMLWINRTRATWQT